MTKTQTLDYGLFLVNPDSQDYLGIITPNSNQIFHGININHLSSMQRPLITPEGDPGYINYFRYFEKRSIHLHATPFLLSNLDSDRIWFGFDVKTFLQKNSNLRYVNTQAWSQLATHADSLGEENRQEYERQLFRSNYSTELEILAEQLDCSKTDSLIVRDKKHSQLAREFAGKELDTVVFELDEAKKLWQEFLNGCQ